MNIVDFPFQAIETMTFNARPQPLSAILRPIYRISLIALVLKINCRSDTASFLKLQFFNWLLKSPSLQKLFGDKIINNGVFSLELIHIDPMVNLALRYAIADKLISVTNNCKYKLTNKGHEFVDQILRDKQSVLNVERELLVGIGKRISEVKLRKELL